MPKVLLLLSNNKEDTYFKEKLIELSRKKGFELLISENFSLIDETFAFVFCVNYQKIIPKNYIDKVKNGIYVFHSSDLPKGKGWAPIYYSIISKDERHVLTMLKINEKVDDGEKIVKAYFKKRKGENADSLREVDNIMTIKLIENTIDDLLAYKIKGKQQIGERTYNNRRTPEMNRVAVNDTLEKIHKHCLAVNAKHPAFYEFEGKKYLISIRPESMESLDERQITITRFYDTYPAQ